MPEMEHLKTKDGSRLCLLVTPGIVLVITTDTTTLSAISSIMQIRKYYQSSISGMMEQLVRLIFWNHLALHSAHLLSGISGQD